MSRPLPVEIVRPDRSTAQLLGMLLGVIISLFVRAWLLMLLAPIIWHPVGYGYALALVFAVSLILGDRSTYRLWTRETRR